MPASQPCPALLRLDIFQQSAIDGDKLAETANCPEDEGEHKEDGCEQKARRMRAGRIGESHQQQISKPENRGQSEWNKAKRPVGPERCINGIDPQDVAQ